MDAGDTHDWSVSRSSRHTSAIARPANPASARRYASSAAVYGAAERLPIAPSAPLRPRSPYGVHKVMAEDVVRSYCARYGLCAAIVRL